jgi:TolB protein
MKIFLRAFPLAWVFASCLGAMAAAAASSSAPMGMITPRLSPDGEWIAVSYQGMIAKVRRVGGPLIVLTRGEGWDSDPAWSRDGTRIAYLNTSVAGGGRAGGTLKFIHADGTAVAMPRTLGASGPLWFHPDGSRLLGRFGPANNPQPGCLDLQSGNVSLLNWGPLAGRMLRQQLTPYALSDDGRFILVAVHQDLPGQQTGDNGPQAELFRLPVEGGASQIVTRLPARIYALSNDGRHRGVYVVTDAGAVHNDIWHVAFDVPERGTRKLTFSQADDDSPTTDARGNWLVHTENARGPTSLVVRNTETGVSEVVRIDRVDFGEPTGTIAIRLSDVEDREPAARISLQRKEGKFYAPSEAMYRITAGLGHFVARAEARLEVPAGDYVLRVLRGPEYRMHESQIEVRPGESAERRVSLERWANMAARGWYSGENHIHANYGYGSWYVQPQSLVDQCEAEDLRVSNLVVANSDGEAVFDREFFTGRPHMLSTSQRILYWNQEFRSTLWGHMTLFHLTRLVEPIFTGFRDTTNPFDVPDNADIAARTKQQGGVASYTHPTNNAEDIFLHAYSAKGLPVDVALGRIDTIDVMGGVYETSLPVWYHVLNCGFHIPAAAGTDCFLNRVRSAPPGYGRVYVHLPGGLDYDQWVAGLKAGRSFVSNGPWLEFTANGKPVGETLALDGAAPIRIRGLVTSQFPLQRCEVVYNGNVVASAALSADKLSAIFDQDIAVERSGWMALRASGPAALYWQGGGRGAHTNPVYIEVRGRPGERAASARYFLAWIDRLEQLVVQRDRMDMDKVHVLAHLEQAREIYREMVR